MGANRNLIQLQGKRFGALVVLRRAGSIGERPTWLCRCDCGNECIAIGAKLRQGSKKSCGQGHHFREPLNEVARAEKRIWNGMLERCTNAKNPAYKNYGARGVKVCAQWRRSFQQFLADVGPRPSNLYSIDRYPDWTGNYEPGNVRWATREQQARNKRVTVRIVIDGVQVPLIDYVSTVGLTAKTVRRRLARGWPLEVALTAPSGTWRNKDPWPEAWLKGDFSK